MGNFHRAQTFSPAHPGRAKTRPFSQASTAKPNLFDPEPIQLILATG